MDDIVISEFSAGVDAYWSGEVAEGWNSPSTREKSPYVMGWYMASMFEVEPGYLLDGDGEPLQDVD